MNLKDKEILSDHIDPFSNYIRYFMGFQKGVQLATYRVLNFLRFGKRSIKIIRRFGKRGIRVFVRRREEGGEF